MEVATTPDDERAGIRAAVLHIDPIRGRELLRGRRLKQKMQSVSMELRKTMPQW
jgi:hypothetical protein